MKLVSFWQDPSNRDPEKLRLGVVVNQQVIPLPNQSNWPTTMIRLIEEYDRWKTEIESLASSSDAIEAAFPLSDVTLDAPVRQMEKLICIGKNYADHAREMGGDPPEKPVVFSKFPSAIIAPGTPVRLPGISEKVDYEAELVVVIGRKGRDIDLKHAFDHIFGYCCGNDVSARDWQKGCSAGQWLLGKTFDTFAPLGPMIVTRDEILDPHQLDIQLTLNSRVMQSANTRDLIFKIDFLVHYISKIVTLKPGDLIFTGTPSGVGAGRTPPVFLAAGDRMVVEVEGLGKLENPVHDEAGEC